MAFSRRNFFARLALYGTPPAAFAYGSLLERRRLSVTRAEVPLQHRHEALDGLKVALMSDFHHDDYGSDALVRRAVEAVNREGVDLVVLAGDFVTKDLAALEPLCAEFSELRPRLGAFATLGNHDRWHYRGSLPGALAEAGVRLLVNEAVDFEDFALAGADSRYGGFPDPTVALAAVPRDRPVLLGWHEPDTFDEYEDSRIALQLSGHTHGGQICAPLYGPLLLPRYGRKYPHGLYRREGRSLFVTRGIGTISVPARFLCPPELALLTLRASPAS